MRYCRYAWCGIAAWWCALGGMLVGLAAAIAWVWSTRVPLDPLEDNPSGMLSVIPEVQALEWRVAGWKQNERAGHRNRIAAALTAVAVVLSSAASLLSLSPSSIDHPPTNQRLSAAKTHE